MASRKDNIVIHTGDTVEVRTGAKGKFKQGIVARYFSDAKIELETQVMEGKNHVRKLVIIAKDAIVRNLGKQEIAEG